MKKLNIVLFVFAFSALVVSIAYAKPAPYTIQAVGSGYLVLEDLLGRRTYSKVAKFALNGDGDLVNIQGKSRLLGYAIEDGTASSYLSYVNLMLINSPAKATEHVTFSGNLDATSVVFSFPFDASSIRTANESSNFSVPIIVYDSLGKARRLELYFVHRAENVWNYYLLVAIKDLNDRLTEGVNTVSDSAAIVEEGSLHFAKNGLLDRVGEAVPSSTRSESLVEPGKLIPSGQIPWKDAEPSQAVRESRQPITMNFAPFDTTQYAQEFSTTSIHQDGREIGIMTGFNVQVSGRLEAQFSNGAVEHLYQIPLAYFIGEYFLKEIHPGTYVPTYDSGLPEISEVRYGDGFLTPFCQIPATALGE